MRIVLFSLGFLVLGLAGYYFWPEPSAFREARKAAERREFLRALELLRDPLERSSASADALLLGARTARRAGEKALAERYLRRYLENGGDSEIGALERVIGGVQRGELGQIDGGLNFCVKNPSHPEVPYILEAMTMGYLKVGNIIRARDTATRWLESGSPPADRAQAHVYRAMCAKAMGDLDSTLAECRAALALVPDFTEAHALAGEALTASNPDAAIEHFDTVLAKEPNRLEARVGLAKCRRNRGEYDMARAELERALAPDATYTPALLERARLELDQRNFEAAFRDANRVLASEPRSRDALTTLARVYQLTGRAKEAGETLAKVKAIEEELFKMIRERVAAGLLPAPPKGTDLTSP